VGGQDKIRPLWRHYYQNTLGLIFVLDSSDRGRIEEAKEELDKLLSEAELSNVLVLIFANKQDLPTALPISEIEQQLGLAKLSKRKWHLQPTCGPRGDGLFDGLDWLIENLRHMKKTEKKK